MNKVKIFERSLIQNDEKSFLPAFGFDDKNHMQKIAGIDGSCQRISIRNGLDVTIFDYYFNQQSAEFARAPAGIELCVLFTGAGDTIALDPNDQNLEIDRIPNRPQTSYIILTQDNYLGKTEIPAKSEFKGISLRILPEFTAKLKGFPTFDELAAYQGLNHSSGDKYWVSMFDTPEPLYRLAKKIYDESFSSQPNDLVLEADILQILTEFINIMRQPSKAPNSSRDKRLLEQAKDMMLNNLAHAWSIHEISSQIGMNKQRLKAGFKAEFGIPVYGFLQAERLKAALKMLQHGELSVTEISLAIGYANPSHFAYLFKRQFGSTPSKIKLHG